MEGTISVENERLIKWSKSEEGVWTIKLVKDEENSESNGHTNLRVETVLSTLNYTEE